jgi:hypothetical protein
VLFWSCFLRLFFVVSSCSFRLHKGRAAVLVSAAQTQLASDPHRCIKSNHAMKCAHCLTSFHDNPKFINLGSDAEGGWVLKLQTCPECRKFIVELINGEPVIQHDGGSVVGVARVKSERLVRPKSARRPLCPKEVPPWLAGDYNEACLVLPDSAKASAALSRRCLQALLRQAAGVKHSDLSKEIQEVLDSGKLPTQLAESIDAIRNIGNFAAHPMKTQHTGEILEVEPGEAEWTLDVLESLFDFYFVQPSILKQKRAALDTKLGTAGKPPMK